MKFDDLIKVPGQGGLDVLPDAPVPYRVGAKDGLFLVRRTFLGRGVVKEKYWPDNWKELGTGDIDFIFERPPIPGVLMAQVVDFFRRIYRARHAEAAVLLTLNIESDEWGVFIPTQLVSHGGVNYVYDAHRHIERPRYVVGSIHSHCDFSPFHSGTDTGDADQFDGLHMTVGYIEKDEPGIVAMMAMNKAKLNYKEADFPLLFDYEQLWKYTAPEWWDQYVGTEAKDDRPVGYELYKKFEKPTTIKQEQRQQNVSHQKPSGQHIAKGQHGIRSYGFENFMEGFGWSGWANGGNRAAPPPIKSDGGVILLGESREFNARKAAERGLRWGEDGRLDLAKSGLKISDVSAEELDRLLYAEEEDDDKDDPFNWQSKLPEGFLEMMEDMNLVTDEDMDDACVFPDRASQVDWWREKMLKKMFNMTFLLRELGMEVNVEAEFKRPAPPKDETIELPFGGSEDMLGVQ